MYKLSCNAQQHIHCQNCSISELCLPFTLNDNELDVLDKVIDRKMPAHKGDHLYNSGDKMKSLYAIRSGSFKSFIIDEQGDEQITGFHLAGDLLGFDAIAEAEHPSFAKALETAMVCEIPYDTLDNLSNTMPRLKKQIMRLMSAEIKSDQHMISLLNNKTAEQKLATFIINLSDRYKVRGLSADKFRLAMTRSDIGNYMGLTVETISRLFNKFHKNGLILLEGKLITILDKDQLKTVAAL
ncbi:fumarate/nitrate reduction transcriptional regulator Fnr [Thalassotalea agarivorans]|uniref:CRP/FNR family transcriptional regulator, anaerobic regulatory protein n=1 Tax=Thalassotalea agarivorans TaxID=349064 RepID=A0A1I0HCC4_THASX|nr:fumarate/nitrate reduction transcriptional regulator Fnr [Thalassotalea agarivorans]SET81520.1 CRP/FNR family transcriptional regulator, anaerobic regulatory protein [Thalassotalea agarivorans]